MAQPASNRVLKIFVQAERGQSGPQWESLGSTGHRLASMVVPGIALKGKPPDPSIPARSDGLEIPYEQAHCVRLVYDLARRLDYSVQVVDVTDPSVARSDVERLIGTGATYPVLLRPDGFWLEGQENFTPSKIRKFLK